MTRIDLDNTPIKILFISSRYAGGVGGHATRTATKLVESGFEISLMHAPHVPIKGLKNPSFALLSAIKAATSREEFDIVHAFSIPAAFAMRYTRARKKFFQ